MIPPEVTDNTFQRIFVNVIKVIIFLLMFFTAFVTFKKHRILRGLESIIALVAIESYMELLIVNSISYISGDFEKVFGDYTSLNGQPSITKVYVVLNFLIQVTLLLI